MRTQQEIIDRINHIKKEDFFGFSVGDLVSFLGFESAKPFLKKEFVEKEGAAQDWKEGMDNLDRGSILATMRDYMEFAQGKATDHRGLSAGRSINHFEVWVWMLGDEDFKALDAIGFENYGAPKLKHICDKYGFPWPSEEEDADINAMARGERCHSCRDGSDSGCGN